MKKIILIAVMMLVGITCSAKWQKVEEIELPKGSPVYKTTTNTGKEKYIICVGDDIFSADVPVSKSNINKQLILVKWKDENGNIKYTTRGKNITPNLNMNKIKVVKK